MTWEELKEEAKKMDAAILADGKTFSISGLSFCENGRIYVETAHYDEEYGEWIYSKEMIADNRSYGQMLTIMKALQ